MKPSKMTKDKTASIRINAEIKERLEDMGYSVQKFLDANLDKLFSVQITDNQLVYGDDRFTKTKIK
jgi:hypothetical protein